MKRIGLDGFTLLLALSCASFANKPSIPSQTWDPELVWQDYEARRSPQFRMIHQVAARFRGSTQVITGHLLGDSNGNFHLIASAPMGPRLFELSKTGDNVRARNSISELQGKVDPKNIASAIDLIYFTMCPKGPGTQDKNEIIFRCHLKLNDIDEARITIDPTQSTVVRKEFKSNGKPYVSIDYRDFARYGDETVAREVHFQHALGFSLDIALLQYDSPYQFDPSQLQLSPN